MFQRLQTFYLLLAAICLVLLFFIPVFKIQIVDMVFDFNITGLEYASKGKTTNIINFPFILVIPALIIYTVASIFLYKNQNRQLKLGRLNYVLIIFITVMMIISLNNTLGLMENSDVARIGYRGFYLPIAAFAFIFLANRAIKRELEIMKIFESIKKK